MITLFVVFNPDHSSVGIEREPFSLKVFLNTFWVSPVAHPDFFWAFLGRIFLYSGYFVATGSTLLLLQNYIGLGHKATAVVAVPGIASLLGVLPGILISGPLSDKFGRRKLFVFIAALLIAVGVIVPLVSPTFTGLLVCFFLAGLGFGAFQSVDTAIMSEVLPSAKSFGKDLGVVNIAATVPQVLAPGAAAAIILLLGYGALFPIGAVLVVLGAFAIWPIKAVR
jgi:MFS family permease